MATIRIGNAEIEVRRIKDDQIQCVIRDTAATVSFGMTKAQADILGDAFKILAR